MQNIGSCIGTYEKSKYGFSYFTVTTCLTMLPTSPLRCCCARALARARVAHTATQVAGLWREAAERWLYLPELLVPAIGLAKREEWVVGLLYAYSALGVAGRTVFVWTTYEVHILPSGIVYEQE